VSPAAPAPGASGGPGARAGDGGFAAAKAERRARRDAWTQRFERSPAALLLALLLVLGGATPYFEATRNANELPRVLQAVAVLDHGRLDVGDVLGQSPGPDVSRSPKDGRVYPNKPPGATVAAIAGVVTARAVGAAFERPVTLRDATLWARGFGALLPTLLLAWLLAVRVGASVGWFPAATATAIWALATPANAYAHVLYGHALTAWLLAQGMAWIVDALDDERPTLAVWGGFAAACAVTVEYLAVFAAVPIAALLLVRARTYGRWGTLARALAGAAVPIAALAAYHHVTFGAPWATGYHHAATASFAAKHAEGFVLGLGLPSAARAWSTWLAPASGLLWWVPLLPVALYGLVLAATDRGHGLRTDARLWLGWFVVLALLVTSLSFEGGWRVGPRYVVPALPALVPGLALVIAHTRAKLAWVVGLASLAVYQAFVNGMAGALWPHIDVDAVHSPVAELLLPLWWEGRPVHGLVGAVGLPDPAWFVVLLGVALVLWLWGRAIEPRLELTVGLVAAFAAGFALVQVPRLVAPHPRGEANLRYVRSVWEPRDDGTAHSAALGPPR
jgi:hypothetical protein